MGFLDSRAATLNGAGNQAYSNKQIQDFIKQPGMTDQKVFDKAMELGISGGQISQSMNGTPGYDLSSIMNYSRNLGVNFDQSPADAVSTPSTPAQQASFTQAVQDPTKGTVAGQLNSVLDPNSTLMKRAEHYGNTSANKRGLLNSSIGIGSAQNAMVDAGLQIATPDAASNNQFAITNAGARNQNSQFNADSVNKSNMFNADLGLRADMFNTDTVQKREMFNQEQDYKYFASKLDSDTRKSLAEIEAQYQKEIQAGGNVSELFNTTIKNIFEFQSNKDMTPETRQANIDSALSLFKSGLSFNSGYSSLDLAKDLQFGSVESSPENKANSLITPGGVTEELQKGTPQGWKQAPMSEGEIRKIYEDSSETPNLGPNPSATSPLGAWTRKAVSLGQMSLAETAEVLQAGRKYGYEPLFVTSVPAFNKIQDPNYVQSLLDQGAIQQKGQTYIDVNRHGGLF